MICRVSSSKLQAGLTLIELLVVVTVISVLMALTMPSIGVSVATSRERGIVQKFTQDFDWARSVAMTQVVTMQLNADCSWTTSINGAADTAHSLTTATMTKAGILLQCQAGSLAVPATWAFTSQGFATPNGTLSFVGQRGQRWALQVLYSGSIVNMAGAS